MSKLDIDILIHTSAFRLTKKDTSTNIAIILALTTDGVNSVKNIKNMISKIVIICIFCFEIPSNFNINIMPKIIYAICIPDTASICDKLLILKLSICSSVSSVFSPSKIPFIKDFSSGFFVYSLSS